MQINPLKDLLKDVQVPVRQPSLPEPKRTPPPERSKVVGIPTRTPVNRQAAFFLSPERDWLAKPLPPEKPISPENEEAKRIQNELKIERNAHAETRDKLGKARIALAAAKQTVSSLLRECNALHEKIEEQDSIIRQLEDLRL